MPLKALGSKIKFYFNLPLDSGLLMVDAIIYISEILAAFQKILSPAILVFMCKTSIEMSSRIEIKKKHHH